MLSTPNILKIKFVNNNKKYLLKLKLNLLYEKEDKVIFQHVQFDAFKYTHICLSTSTYVCPPVTFNLHLPIYTCIHKHIHLGFPTLSHTFSFHATYFISDRFPVIATIVMLSPAVVRNAVTKTICQDRQDVDCCHVFPCQPQPGLTYHFHYLNLLCAGSVHRKTTELSNKGPRTTELNTWRGENEDRSVRGWG